MKDVLGFHRSVQSYPNNDALDVDGRVYTYSTLSRMVKQYGETIRERTDSMNPFVGILAYRSAAMYAGLLGILAMGAAYVPLNPKYPIARLKKIIEISNLKTAILGEECLVCFEELVQSLDERIDWVVPSKLASDLKTRFPGQKFSPLADMTTIFDSYELKDVPAEDYAYLVFTSGSTGVPKGVGVTVGNLSAFSCNQLERYNYSETDRFSQTADISFDLSIQDLALAWQKGSCLCALPESHLIAPGHFIIEKRITFWCSVPSVGIFMDRLRMLQPDTYPFLRYAVFCGEPLPQQIAQKWQAAAPNAVIDNLYGPSEATCAITSYIWDPIKSPAECEFGIVPIGKPFKNQEIAICEPNKNVYASGNEGELCLAGSQVTRGYLNDQLLSLKQYIRLPGSEALWYRTGDLVRLNANSELVYISRIDNLVKIRGYRVEMQEIEFILTEATKSENVVALAWPIRDGVAERIVAFVAGEKDLLEKQRIIAYCRAKLPQYMIPKDIYIVPSIPTNINGKADRKRLIEMLDRGEASG